MQHMHADCTTIQLSQDVFACKTQPFTGHPTCVVDTQEIEIITVHTDTHARVYLIFYYNE